MKELNDSVSAVFEHDPCWFRQFFSGMAREYFQGKTISVLSHDTVSENLKSEIVRFSQSDNILSNAAFESDIVFALVSDSSVFDCSELTVSGSYGVFENGRQLWIVGYDAAGLLYGFYHLIFKLSKGEPIVHVVDVPQCPLRMINHWDNMDELDHMGSVERGYSGKSIFFRNFDVTTDLSRIEEYARLLSSVGINAVAINNVNVHELETKLITDDYLLKLKGIADIFEKFAVKMYLSINFSSPMTLGELATSDPLDETVMGWWDKKVAAIYSTIPNLGGFVVKADSEGRSGPFTYGRNHADGANLLGRAVKPFGGVVVWRCFVYNCQQDWRDRRTDRAKAAYDNFIQLDGLFLDNVVLQIKCGPMDFQVREPVSPLLGAMPNTNCVMELQIAQEYTGQQKHVCYLGPQWKTILDFDTELKGQGSTIRNLVKGDLNTTPINGLAAVSNIGDDDNWCGHHLAQANFYAFGRMSWNLETSPEVISEDWTRLTFGAEQAVVESVTHILDTSWLTYEKYTAPLGVGWMVCPNHHYGPSVDGYEYDRWGTYHFADCHGIGVDRTHSGSDYVSQYATHNMNTYNHLDTCPDELLLFFHHVGYDYELKSGKTVIQHIYDTHFEGVEWVSEYVNQWSRLEGKIDTTIYNNVGARLSEQLEHSTLWRDVINTYFYRKSGIADAKNRQIYP